MALPFRIPATIGAARQRSGAGNGEAAIMRDGETSATAIFSGDPCGEARGGKREAPAFSE
jgi:hypothetical protein